MAKYLKVLHAGRYTMAVAYSKQTPRDHKQARAEKRKHSDEAQKRMNEKSSLLQLTAIIAENFADSKTALFVSPTFDADHYPLFLKPSLYWDYCNQEAKKFMARLKTLANRRGDVLKYVYCPGIGEGGRWHFHALVDGVTREDVRAAWGRGDADAHRLYKDHKWVTDREWSTKADNVNPVAIAKYMMRNASVRLLGKHPWHYSRTCIKPKPEAAQIVRDGEPLPIPHGADILTQERTDTIYSRFEFVEYIGPKPKRLQAS